MDSLLPLICLAIGSAIPLAALFLLVRRGMRQLAVAVAYREVANRLGLSADTRGLSLQGHLGDRRLWIGEVMVGHGTDRQMRTWGVMDLERPLGLGLLIRRRGLSERLFRRSRAPETRLGDPWLDPRLEIRGDDPSRIQTLLTEEVREALRALARTWPDVVVTDQSVRVHLRQAEASDARLQRLVDAMLNLAVSLEKSRRAVPPPAPLEAQQDTWREIAQNLGLVLESWLPAATGEIDGRRLLLFPRRSAHGYTAELRLFFREHRSMGFRMRPQVEPDGYWSVGQDIQVDEDRFDAAFVIKGWDPDRVREMLHPAVREDLLALAAEGSVEADDRALRIKGLPLDGEILVPVAHRALRTAEALGW